MFNAGFSHHVGHIVQITGLVCLVMIDGWRKTALMNGQRRENRLNSPGTAEQMSGHGFGRADGQFVSMLFKYRFNR